jgi:acetate kinase
MVSEIHQLNKRVIHGGNLLNEAIVIKENFKKTSKKHYAFQTLYALEPDEALYS